MQKKNFIIIGIILIVLFFVYKIVNTNIAKEPNPTDPKEVIEEVEPPIKEKVKPKTVNGLLVGNDVAGGLTDVLMVGHIDTESNDIKIISIPRDLQIDFTKEPFKELKSRYKANRIAHCQINEIYNNMGRTEDGLATLKEVIEIITGLDIDYMATIDPKGFRSIVDLVGGVEYDVPKRMYHRDPYQNLFIDLQPGLQLLDGDKAEQLVRYRKYKMGDLDRIKVQQDFILHLYKKVIAENDVKKLAGIAKEVFNMVEADFGILVLSDYLDYFLELDLEDILKKENMITIPSWGEKKQIDGKDRWFQYWKLEDARKAVDDLLNPKPDQEEADIVDEDTEKPINKN